MATHQPMAAGAEPGRVAHIHAMPTGGAIFAGVILLLVGAFDIIFGLTALLNNQVFVATTTGLIVWNFTAWGWIHLIFGVILILASLALFRMAEWARWLAVFLAGVNAVAEVAFITAYPLWTVLVVGLDVLVIYQLAMHWEPASTEHASTASR